MTVIEMLYHIKTRRKLVRLFSFALFAFVVAICFAITGFWIAYRFRMTIEYSYQRALTELSEHVNNIDLALQKGYYASTTTQLVGLSAQIWSDAGAAKSDLSQMPLSDVKLDNTNKFISQVGDYANSLGKQLAFNQKITDEQRAQIKTLSDTSQKLSTQLNDIIADMQSGKITLFKSDNALYKSDLNKVVKTSLQDGFEGIEKTFAGLPSMIYDGPFSDNILRKEPLLIKDKPQISQDQARQNAADFLKIDKSKLGFTGETAGSLPTFNFEMNSINIYISKAGGYVVRMINSRTVANATLDSAAATAKASEFLVGRGINSMIDTYYLANNNIGNINFAYKKNDVTIYPDLIKLGIALDTGEVISFDATGYIMNHTKRTLPTPKITQSSIRNMLNPALKVEKVLLSLIPTDGGGEALCYEFRCKGENNQSIIDFFNTQSGLEQQLLILLDTPGGMLPM